jgi:radical SAM protein with 4Fe4S-binding SPASM domain
MNEGNNSGRGIGCVSWDGEVYADQFWRHHSFGNVRQRPFSEIWTQPEDPLLLQLKEKKIHVKGRCAGCAWLDVCGGNFRVRAKRFTMMYGRRTRPATSPTRRLPKPSAKPVPRPLIHRCAGGQEAPPGCCCFPTIAPDECARTSVSPHGPRNRLLRRRFHPAAVLPWTAKGSKNPIDPCRAVYQLSSDNLVKEAGRPRIWAFPAIILFGCRKKDPLGTQAYAKDGIVQQAVKEVKNKVPDLAVITDVCLCAYTDHGHCGVVEQNRGQRRHTRSAGPHGPVPRQGRRRHGGPVRYDGRPGG